MRLFRVRGGALGALTAPLLALALAPTLATPARAQGVSPGCAEQLLVQDACQKAADIFTLLAPQLGTVVAGGNALLGPAGALGRPLRIAVGLRATGLSSTLPEVADVSTQAGAAQRDVFPVRGQLVALPQLDVAVGLFGGVPLALTNVGAVDLLLSGAWIPEVAEDDVQIRTPDGQFRLGYGARVALLQEGVTLPSVAVTVMRRELPELEVSAQPTGDDSLSVSGMRVRADSWRLVAGKSLLTVVSLAVGGGQDRYDARTALSAVVREGGLRFATSAPVPFAQEVTRSTLFADLAVRLGAVQLVGEVGRVWGGELATFNEFDDTPPDEARLYASAGVRVGF